MSTFEKYTFSFGIIDGLNVCEKTILEFIGCFWHGYFLKILLQE